MYKLYKWVLFEQNRIPRCPLRKRNVVSRCFIVNYLNFILMILFLLFKNVLEASLPSFLNLRFFSSSKEFLNEFQVFCHIQNFWKLGCRRARSQSLSFLLVSLGSFLFLLELLSSHGSDREPRPLAESLVASSQYDSKVYFSLYICKDGACTFPVSGKPLHPHLGIRELFLCLLSSFVPASHCKDICHQDPMLLITVVGQASPLQRSPDGCLSDCKMASVGNSGYTREEGQRGPQIGGQGEMVWRTKTVCPLDLFDVPATPRQKSNMIW